jgi:hypothetical protein
MFAQAAEPCKHVTEMNSFCSCKPRLFVFRSVWRNYCACLFSPRGRVTLRHVINHCLIIGFVFLNIKQITARFVSCLCNRHLMLRHNVVQKIYVHHRSVP